MVDPATLPAWNCNGCGQKNSGWATECGRCNLGKSNIHMASHPEMCGAHEPTEEEKAEAAIYAKALKHLIDHGFDIYICRECGREFIVQDGQDPTYPLCDALECFIKSTEGQF